MAQCKVVCLLYLLGYPGATLCLSISSFSLGTLCNFQEMFTNGCFKSVKNRQGQLGCLVACGLTEDCTGAVTFASSSECYHELVCSFTTTCSSPVPNARYYHKVSPAVNIPTASTLQTTTTQSTTTSYISTTPSSTEKETTSTVLVITQSSTDQTSTPSTTTPQHACQNLGTPLTSLKCNCSETGGWAGPYCERRPHNCSELPTFGYSNGTLLIQIDIYRNNSFLINTPCNVGSTRNEVGFLRNTGQYSFNKRWQEYVQGFYFNTNNYWLGLDNIVTYSNLGLSKIGVHLSFSSATVKGSINQEYSGCRFLGNASKYSYIITNGGSSTRSVVGSGNLQVFDLGDVFGAYQTTPFSSPDRDQDLEPGKNCADQSATGWWFKTCSPEAPVNPMGNFVSSNEAERIILPKYNTSQQGPREAFKFIYMSLFV